MKRILGVLAAALVACGLVAAPAGAAVVVTDPLAGTVAGAQEVAAFWLGEGGANLANATPYDVQTAIGGEVVPVGDLPIETKPGSVPPLPLEEPGQPDVTTPPSAGKVFFVGADGLPHYCSGTSVNSQYRNLVATAGRCTYDLQDGTTLDKWVFVPGYSAGTLPWGLYVGKQAFTHADFRTYGDHDRDYAFVTVYRGVISSASGQLTDTGRLSDNVGAQGLAFNRPMGTSVDVFGYPAGAHPDGSRPYTGATIETSSGPTSAVAVPSLPADGLVRVDSGFTGAGSLGSSWLSSYSEAQRVGYLTGITIGVADTDGDLRYDTSVSPYFDTQLSTVFSAAKSSWTGGIA
ncbi:hypothetical protein GCM10022419_062870 [Nonomuraea rosea]|uniref:Uncharacterized protein n=1 Tax=Nonomuraea rosea TaxID=638574 RepID=A0ABP6Y1D7_9ACTN